MKKFIILICLLFLSGCITLDNGDDPRPPLMDDTEFHDFQPQGTE